MEELLKVIEVWRLAEETLNLSSQKGSYMDGYHKGFIKAINDVRELLASQQPNAADGVKACPGGVYYIEYLDSETVRLIPRAD